MDLLARQAIEFFNGDSSNAVQVFNHLWPCRPVLPSFGAGNAAFLEPLHNHEAIGPLVRFYRSAPRAAEEDLVRPEQLRSRNSITFSISFIHDLALMTSTSTKGYLLGRKFGV